MPRPVPKKLIFVVLCFAAIGLLSVIGCGVDCWFKYQIKPNLKGFTTTSQDKNGNKKKQKEVLTISSPYKCPYTKDKTKCKNWYSEQDIMVQNKSLDLNQYLFWATLFGIGLVAATLWQTQIAVKTANNANAITKEGFEKQLRAYLNVESITFESDPLPQWNQQYLFRFKINIKNFGQTPAYKIQVLGKVVLRKTGIMDVFGEEIAQIDFIGQGIEKNCDVIFECMLHQGQEYDARLFNSIFDLTIEYIDEFSGSNVRSFSQRYSGVTNEKYMTLVDRSIRQVDSRNMENC